MGSMINLSDLSAKCNGYFLGIREEMIEFVPKTAERILEVGCGAGLFGALIKKRIAAEVWGIEIDQQAAKKAAENIDKVIVGDVGEMIGVLPQNFFDCVVFNDVLEHLVNPYRILELIKNNLSATGVVCCSIPNVRYYRNLINLVLRKQWEYKEDGIMDKTHLRFFTEKSIKRMFHLLDYEITIMRGINPTNSLFLRVITVASFGWLSDILYLQFACQARPKS